MKRIACAPVNLKANTPLKRATQQAPKQASTEYQRAPVDPSKVYLYGYHLEGREDAQNRASQKRYALSSVASATNYLKSFNEGIYIELVPHNDLRGGAENQLMPPYRNHIPGITFGGNGYSAVIKGYKNGTGETIFVLPSAKSSLAGYLYSKLLNNVSQGKFFQRIDVNAVRQLLSAKPVESVNLLTKDTLDKMGRSGEQVENYSLKQLKDFYGQHFPYHFSSVYIYTDNNPTAKENRKGKPVVFYSKNPDGKRTVDDLITARMIGPEQLGTMWIDEDMAFRNVEELANHFYVQENGHKLLTLPELTSETRLFMGPWFSKQLYQYFNDKHEVLLQRYGKEFQNIFNFIKDEKAYDSESDRQNYIASQLLHFVLRAYDEKGKYKELLNDIDTIIQSKQGGVYVSPGLVYNYLKDVPFAPLDTINEQYAQLLDKKLVFKNLAKDPLSIPSLSLNLTETSIDQLLSPRYQEQQTNDQLPGISRPLQEGQVIHEDVGALMNILSQYGITMDELSNVLHKKLLPLVQNETAIDPALQVLLDEFNC